MVVPQTAVMQDANGSYVYCVDTKNSIKIVPIKTGLNTSDGGWIIDEGLKTGDKVVVSDIMKLRQGMRVNPEITQVKN